MSVTLKDIARKTNLSLGTVSNYINGRPIKERNRLLIEQAIRDLNYSVNQLARGLRTNRSSTIGIIMPSLDDPYAGKIASYLTCIFRKNNYAVIICDAPTVETEADVIRFMINKQVEGVISFPVSEERTDYAALEDYGIPCIFIDKAIKGLENDVFLLNNREISRKAIRLAIEKGHRRIGILAGTDTLTAEERLQGYLEALNEADIPVCEKYVKRATYNDQDLAISVARELLSEESPPTAVFATNYFFTLGLVAVCNEMQLQIGKDLHIIGFDDIMLNELIRPKLCIVAQPMRDYAEQSSDLLLKIIRGEIKAPKKIHFCSGYIIEGESLGKI